MLHIGLLSVRARERGVQFGDAVGGEGFQLVGVQKILIGMAAAEEQHRRAERGAFRLAVRALLQEAAERCQARSGTDHDHGHRGIVRQAEAGLGLAHRRMNGIADAAAGEIVGADALVDAAPRTRGCLHHADGDAAAFRVDRG